MTQYYTRTSINFIQSDCMSSSNETNESDCTFCVNSEKRTAKVEHPEKKTCYTVAQADPHGIRGPNFMKMYFNDFPADLPPLPDCSFPSHSGISGQSFLSSQSHETSMSSDKFSDSDYGSDEEMECSVCDSCDSVDPEDDNEVTSRADGASDGSTNLYNSYSADKANYQQLLRWMQCAPINNSGCLQPSCPEQSGSLHSQGITGDGQAVGFPQGGFNHELYSSNEYSAVHHNALGQQNFRGDQIGSVDPLSQLGGGNSLTVVDFLPSAYSGDSNFFQQDGMGMFNGSSSVNEQMHLDDLMAFRAWLNQS